MARDTTKTKPKKKKKKARKGLAPDIGAEKLPKKGAKTAGKKKARVVTVIESAKTAASKLKDNPVVSEIVAAALVATAAALKDPNTARKLAAEAGDQLQRARAKATRNADAFWTLALDVARRSIDALEGHDKARSKLDKKQKK